MGVVRGVDRFEGRSSFKTWLFRILVNRARTSGVREHRHVSLDPTEPAVSPDRFDGSGAWAEPVTPWEDDVDDRLVAAAWGPAARRRSTRCPHASATWCSSGTSRDSRSEDVCDVLGISEGNQRVLLHRGRSRLRTALESELETRGR